MAWARDKNGREFWLDESGVLPPMAREELDKPMPLPDWPGGARRHQPGVKVPEGFELMDAPSGARDGGRAAERSLHGGPTDVAGRGMLPAQGPRQAETPFADSMILPEVRRPVELPPETVEATRLPPVVEGVTMRRGAPGSGDFGERADLTPTVFRRDTPMSMRDAAAAGLFESRVPKGVSMDPSDAYRAGLIDVYAGRGAPQGVPEATARGLVYAVPLNREGPQDMTAANRINATPGKRAFDMEMRSEDAAAMRQGFRAESGARQAAAAMRATGRVGASRDIVAKILGEEQADAASDRRMREARVTPQVRDGVAYDPLTGRSAEVQRGGGAVRPTKWEEYTPKELGDMVNDAVRSMMPEGDSAAFKMALLTAKTDEEKQEVYRKFQARPTPAQQLIMDTALAELEKRGGAKPQGGGAGGGGAVYKPGMFGKR